VSVQLLVRCDGTPDDRPGMALERCRAFLPVDRASHEGARNEATAQGWRCSLDRDLCPACARGSS
jgi:hypothetical protein